MTGSGSSSQSSRYTHNDAAFAEYNTRFQSSNLSTFAVAASKFTEWLGSDKAYYPNARTPIVSIIESAHANICRVQGDPSVPFKLEKALPGLDAWYQPYLSLLKQVGSRMNYFEPELRERLQLLVENAGIRIVQVPTLSENTGAQQKLSTPTERRRGDAVPADASSQMTVPRNVAQQTKIAPPVAITELQKRGRRKLNRAIFDVDTAAALRNKVQTGPQTVEANSSEVAIQRRDNSAVHPPVQCSSERAQMEYVPNAEESTECHSQGRDSGPSPGLTVATSILLRTENPVRPEVASVEPPQRVSAACGLDKAVPGDEAEIHTNDSQLRSDAPAGTSSPKQARTDRVDERVPGPPDTCLEKTLESMAVGPSIDSLVPTPSPGGAETKWPQDRHGTMEEVGREFPPGDGITHDTMRRRKNRDFVGGEKSGASPEPPAKRIRAEYDTTGTTSVSISQTTTPGVQKYGPSDPVTRATLSLSVAREIQRSNSDMILESENETSPPPQPDRGVADTKINDDQSPPTPGRQLSIQRQTEAPRMESQKAKVAEVSMPPIQDLSLASSDIKPNPFTMCNMSLYPPGALPLLVQSSAILDVERRSLRAPTVDLIRSDAFTANPQMETKNPYIFSAAEIRTLVAWRGSDEGFGPNKLVFNLDWEAMNGIAKWRNFKAGQGQLEDSFCLSLACYPVDSVAALMSTATENQPFDSLIRHARIKSSWPSGPSFRSTLKDFSGKSYAIPPFSTTDDNFIDISDSAILGVNTYIIEDNGQSLSNWLFAVYAHTPTVAYFGAAQARLDRERKWVDTLTSFTMYSLPVADWDTSQSPDTD